MDGKIIKASLYTVFLNILFVPFSETVAAVFGYISIILFFIYPIVRCKQGNSISVNSTTLICIVIIISSLLNSMIWKNDLSFEEIEKGFLAVLSFIVFYWAVGLPSKEDALFELEDLYKVNYLLSIVYIAFAVGPFDFKYQIVNEYGDKIFTLGLGNPNAVSIYVLFSILILCFKLVSLEKVFIRIIDVTLIFVLIAILFMLSSRTAFLCLIVILIYLFFNIRKIRGFPYIALASPIIMVVLQLRIHMFNVDYQLMGKAIDTGRSELYKEFIRALHETPWKFIFGDICNYWFENLHNGMLTIFASLGFVGVIFFYAFWIIQIKKYNSSVKNRIQNIAFFVLMVFIVQSSAESMLVIGTVPYSIFVLIIVEIAKGGIRSKNETTSGDSNQYT